MGEWKIIYNHKNPNHKSELKIHVLQKVHACSWPTAILVYLSGSLQETDFTPDGSSEKTFKKPNLQGHGSCNQMGMHEGWRGAPPRD